MTIEADRAIERYGVPMTGVGLVLVREALDDRLTGAILQELGDSLADAGVRLVTRVVENLEEELRVYQAWKSTGSVDAVALFGLGTDDGRIPLLKSLDLPFAALADAQQVDGYSAVVFDTAASVEIVRRHLADTGRGRAIYVAGPEGAVIPDGRVAALARAGASPTIDVIRSRPDRIVQDALDAAGTESAELIVDGDVAAVALVAALIAKGRRVPEDVAVLCWTDSVLCQSAQPTITAVNQRASELGALLGDCLVRAAASEAPVIIRAAEPFLVVRESA
jgi:DNA-binding LacI/PurR family transcriptional regulator